MENGGNVFDHINQFNELVYRIMNAGDKSIIDDKHTLLLLASLSKSYKSLV